MHSFKECEKCWSNLTLIESRKCFVQSIHIKTELHGKSFRCKFTASRWDLSFNYWHIRSIWVNTHAIPFPHWFHCAHCIRPFFIAHMLRNTALEKSQPAQPIRENFLKLYFWWGRKSLCTFYYLKWFLFWQWLYSCCCYSFSSPANFSFFRSFY